MKRVLLKISGETIMGTQQYGIDHTACLETASSIKNIRDQGVEIGLVIGGGNIFRGLHHKELGLERSPADQMGMLATLINGIALQQSLMSNGIKAKVISALECPKVAESFQWNRVMEDFSNGYTLIFVGGTGNPYFTTDTNAAMRGCEIHADILLKATKVDGIYDKDPMKHKDAKKFDTLAYSEYLTQNLKVMDATSVALCRDNNLPICVFDMSFLGNKNLVDLVSQNKLGTTVKGE